MCGCVQVCAGAAGCGTAGWVPATAPAPKPKVSHLAAAAAAAAAPAAAGKGVHGAAGVCDCRAHLLVVHAAGAGLVPQVCREEAPVVSVALVPCCLRFLQEHEVGELVPAAAQMWGCSGGRGCVVRPCCCLLLLKLAEADPASTPNCGPLPAWWCCAVGCCCCCGCWMSLAYRPHQSTVPPASASIFMNSWATCWGLRFTPRWGPSLAQNSSMSSSPDPSSSAACGQERYCCEPGLCFQPLQQSWGARLKDLLERLELLQVDFVVHAAVRLLTTACCPICHGGLCGAGCSTSGS